MPRRARSQGRSKAIERGLREQVAACTRLLTDLGILGYSGHVSARLPGCDAFLVQPFDQSRATLRPDDLLICDFERSALARPPVVRPPAVDCLPILILHSAHDMASSIPDPPDTNPA